MIIRYRFVFVFDPCFVDVSEWDSAREEYIVDSIPSGILDLANWSTSGHFSTHLSGSKQPYCTQGSAKCQGFTTTGTCSTTAVGSERVV